MEPVSESGHQLPVARERQCLMTGAWKNSPQDPADQPKVCPHILNPQGLLHDHPPLAFPLPKSQG